MTLIRIWDTEFTLLHSVDNDNLSEAMREAEDFARGRAPDELLHYTIDPIGLAGGFRYRNGGQLVRHSMGAVEWRNKRDLLLGYITVPTEELAKYRLEKPIGPGDKIAVEIGGQLYTDTIESIRTEPSKREPVAAPRRPWWRRALRTLTPRRWREPDLWSPPGGNLPSAVITTIGDGPPYQLGKDIVLGERQDLTDPAYWTDQPE